MASWCILNTMLHRLKSSKNVIGASVKAYVRVHKIEAANMGEICAAWDIRSTHVRLLHVSDRHQNKRLPSGVAPRRKPLKTTKRIELTRVKVYSEMTIRELAAAMNKPLDHVFEVLLFIPGTERYDHSEAVLDRQTIVDIVKKSGMLSDFVSTKVKVEKNADVVRQPSPDPSLLVKRPPVVTIMGHVDHGKTTLLDQLRHSNTVEKEFGGITQHIGAFNVTLSTGESICFLDTPGHAAFSAMRARGAHLTDIVVLVVAADDGVMPQTIESIQHARDAGVPIIVAINKVDKNNADVERSKKMLLEHQIFLEEFGGDVQAVPISALKGTNLLELQEAIVTQAELMSLRGDPVGLVEGTVVEARVDDKRGRLVTAVIQRGTLRKGQHLVAGTSWAKVRAMFDDSGHPTQEAGPGNPVEILGWKETPSAGDEILQVKDESELKQVVAWRQEQKKKMKQEEDHIAVLEKRSEHDKEYKTALITRRKQGFFRSRHTEARTKELSEDSGPQFSLVLKGDVDGSVEALLDTLDTYKSRKCRLDIIQFGVGNVSETDVEMAATFNGEVYAFNVQVPEKVAELAKSKEVPIRRHNIIYRLFEDLVNGLNKRLPKIQEEVVIGESKVLQVFKVTLPNKKVTHVAGCRCTLGSISKKFKAKVLRNEEVVCEGNILSLKHFKNEVDSIKKEEEFGLCLDSPDFVFQPQDIVRNVDFKETAQEIDWKPGFVAVGRR